MTASVDFNSIKSSLLLCDKFSQVRCAIGLHPSNLLSKSWQEILRTIKLVEKNVSRACAIGEIGLDFKLAKMPPQRELQENVFKRFVKLAQKNKRPVCVHARYAETRCLDILQEEGATKIHMHWFTNSKKTSTRAVSMGAFISCGPIILSDLQSAQVVKSIPLENLLVETDSPVEFCGEKSEPFWIPKVCQKIADIKGISAKEVEKATWDNFCLLFGK